MLRNPAFWIVIVVLVLLLFGASKLPDIAGNLGKGLKVFKKEIKDLQEDTDMSDAKTVINDPPESSGQNQNQNQSQQATGQQNDSQQARNEAQTPNPSSNGSQPTSSQHHNDSTAT